MLELFWTIKAQAQHILYVILFLMALFRGAPPERFMAGALLAMPATDAVYHFAVGGSVYGANVDLGHAVIDVAMLPLFCGIALHANRVYPLWIGAAQIIAVLAHLYRAALEQIDLFAYGMMSIMPSYIQLSAMGVGLAFHMSRHRRLGSYPSWRSYFYPMRVPAAMK